MTAGGAGQFTIDGTEFLLNPAGMFLPDDSPADGSGPMVALRSRAMVDRLLELRDQLDVRRLVEIGIWRGGNAALLESIFKPEVLVGIELSTDRASALDRYIDERGLDDAVSVHYGIDQADQAAVLAAVSDSTGSESIDLVVDDASHRYAPTRASFCALFPLLRPGGRYVLEDWAWSVLIRDPDTHDAWKQLFADRYDLDQPLSALVGELAVMAATSEAVASVEIRSDMVIVERGEGRLDPCFDLDAHLVATTTHAFVRGAQ